VSSPSVSALGRPGFVASSADLSAPLWMERLAESLHTELIYQRDADRTAISEDLLAVCSDGHLHLEGNIANVRPDRRKSSLLLTVAAV
jgi:hypothetical protein